MRDRHARHRTTRPFALSAALALAAAALATTAVAAPEEPAPAPPGGAAKRQPAYELKVLAETVGPAEAEKKQACVEGSPTGEWRFILSEAAAEHGLDWTVIEIEDRNTEVRSAPIRVYRLSGPCWAPDGTYYVYGEGGIVKAGAPGRAPTVIYQDMNAPRGGIYPDLSYNFRWGTAMSSLSFVTVDDPDKEQPFARRVTLRLK